MKLESQDRLGLLLTAFALSLVLAMLLYLPAGPRRAYTESEQEVESLQEQLQLTRLMKLEEEQRLESQQQLIQRLEERGGAFNLFSFLQNALAREDLAARASLRSIDRRNASENQDWARLELDNVALKELLDLLHTIYESENLVVVYSLDIQPAARDQGLNCTLDLFTITGG